ncbi:MAG: S8 family serine peptidase, partial [Bacteroidota bacterium]
NAEEVPGNGKDDDNNGYVDDIHGWNFIGGSDGRDINYENLEVVRLYSKLKKKYANRNREGLPKAEKKEYDKIAEYEKEIKENQEKWAPQLAQVKPLFEMAEMAMKTIGKEPADITKEDIDNLDDTEFGLFKNVAGRFLAETDFAGFYDEIKGYVEYMESQVEYNYNPDFDARDIVGDDPSNLDDRNYGNNNYEGPDAAHGTHVAGIIAAIRDNGIGVDGVGGANVRIMSVRTVPNGDERDKDVANAIRYAVDNGASVINMSFGKGYSPYKGAVDDAVRYAEKNDVLLVHAAGNDGKELTLTNNYPNDIYLKRGFLRPKGSRVWLEVGASTSDFGEGLPAGFSNYNTEYVDVFAPGRDIYSTVPESEYSSFNGTSMAAPMVAGIAALLRSYFPDLTARQVREIIIESALPASLSVVKPGTESDKVDFNRLSATGALANAYAAVKLAETTKGKKKRTAERDASLKMY